MNTLPPPTAPPITPRRRALLPVPLVLGLAALGVPRVVLHDLDTVSSSSVLYLALTIGPPLVWLAALVRVRPGRIVASGLLVGAVHGVLLAVTHQLLWTRAFDEPPRLGGNLEGELSPWLEDVVLRAGAVTSSLGTGVAVGAIVGLVARAIVRARARDR